MRITIVLLIYCLVFQSYLLAQTGFEKVYGGSANDMLRTIYPANDGNLIVAGYTESFGAGTVNNPDFYVVTIKPDGDTLWTRTFGSTSPDYGYAITGLTNGYVFAGESVNPSNNTYDFFAVKTDFNGNPLWQNYYGANGGDYCVSALTLPGDRLLLAGSTNSNTYGSFDFYLVAVDADGNQLAEAHYGGTGTDILKKVIKTNDHGYLLIGNSISFTTTFDVFAVKVDSNFVMQWSQTFDSPGTDYGYDAIAAADGTFYLLANQPVSTDSGSINIIHIDSAGLNAVALPVAAHAGDYAYGLAATTDGFLIAGNTFSQVKGSEFLLVKTNMTGDTAWSKHFGGLKNEVAFSLLSDASGNIYVVGETEGFGTDDLNGYVVKLDAAGTIPCPATVSFTAGDSSICEDQAIFFNNTTVSSTAFEWRLNGNLFSQEINTAYYFADAGNDIVSLTSCIASAEMPVSIFPKPPADFTYVSSGVTATFSLATAFTPAFFSWNFGDGSPDNTIDLNPTHQYPFAGTYWVTFSATDEQGCDSTFISQVELVTGIQATIEQPLQFSVSPNPVQEDGVFMLHGNLALPLLAEIYDLAGRKLMQLQVTQENQALSVKFLQAGTYLLQLKSDRKMTGISRFIVE